MYTHILSYTREDLPCRLLKNCFNNNAVEGMFLELNLRKSKWLIFGGYNNNKANINNFLIFLGNALDHYTSKYDNILLLGDFNSECREIRMSEFCGVYNLHNLVKGPTCFKNPLNPSCIDLMLTNRPSSFKNTLIVETGLSDHHKMTVSVLRLFVPKQSPVCINYRDYKKFNAVNFSAELDMKLNNLTPVNIKYELFQSTFIELLDKHAPLKKKIIRANNTPFMNRTLSKAIMTRSRLRNRFLKDPSKENEAKYKKQRNFCANLTKKVKKEYYNNLDLNLVLDNKKFWKTIKPLFSEKHNISKKVTLIEGDSIITDDNKVAETFNYYFSNMVSNSDISEHDMDSPMGLDAVNKSIMKFREHPSILKIKEATAVIDKNVSFSFNMTKVTSVISIINRLNINKPTTFNCIPVKMIVVNKDICAPFISKLFNDSLLNREFPNDLKLADITPAHKKLDKTNKDNYRPVSVLPCISKIFERLMEEQISTYMEKFLSNYLCGFRKGYNTEQCLLSMIESWRKALDKRNIAGALLTDLSKAFDCLNHELLVAKLNAYGFDHVSLSYIYSYLSDRKHRTKINNTLSSWADISTGIPQGSIIGPLLFNIYINDIFFFIDEGKLANYADDNTLFVDSPELSTLLRKLENDTSILVDWLKNNYFKLNAGKCQLLVANHTENVSVNVDNEKIECSDSVKLLGVLVDYKLDFNEHVSKLCDKVSSKLHALSRISSFMRIDRLKLLMKAFIESNFGYCPLIWMFHNRTLNNRINRLHERALRIVYKNSNSSFAELLALDNSFTIHERNLQKLATAMYKIINNLSPPLENMIPISSQPYNLRVGPVFNTSNVHTVLHGTETISFRGPKTWLLVPEDIKNSKSLIEFKTKIKRWTPSGCTCRLCKIYVPRLGFL